MPTEVIWAGLVWHGMFLRESLCQRNVITRAVGNRDYVQVDTGLVRIDPGDRFLLCSDGLHGYLRDEDVAPIVAQGGDAAVKSFIDLANSRGGKDNITAILVEID